MPRTECLAEGIVFPKNLGSVGVALENIARKRVNLWEATADLSPADQVRVLIAAGMEMLHIAFGSLPVESRAGQPIDPKDFPCPRKVIVRYPLMGGRIATCIIRLKPLGEELSAAEDFIKPEGLDWPDFFRFISTQTDSQRVKPVLERLRQRVGGFSQPEEREKILLLGMAAKLMGDLIDHSVTCEQSGWQLPRHLDLGVAVPPEKREAYWAMDFSLAQFGIYPELK